MRKLTRILAAFLAVSLLSTAFCACGSRSGTTEAAASQNTAVTATDSAAAAPETDAPGSDDPQAYWVSDEKQTLTYWFNYGQDAFALINSFDENRGYQVAEELTNVHLKFQAVSMDQQTEEFHIMIASGDWPDVVQNLGMLYTGGAVAAYTDGIIIDFSDLADECMPNYTALVNADPDTAKAVVTDDGKMLSLYTLYQEYMQGPTNGMMIRQDWLDDLGLSVPQTYDELHDVLTAFRNEKDAESPMLLNNTGAYENDAFAAGFGISAFINTEGDGVVYPFYQQDGKVKFGLCEDGFTDYVTTLNQWLKEGLINKDFTSITGNPMDDQYMAAVAASKTGYFNAASMMIDTLQSSIADAGADIEPMADVGKTEGQSFDLGWRKRNYNTAGASITTTCKIPEIALKWADFFYTDKGSVLTTYGVEGESFDYVDGTPKFSTLVTNNPDGTTPVTVLTKYTIGVDSLRSCFLQNRDLLSEKASSAENVWGSNRTGDGVLPINVSMTSEETEEFNSHFGDLCTYCQEMTAKFISGDEPLTDIPEFQARLKDMGIDKCIELKQAALDRYNAR